MNFFVSLIIILGVFISPKITFGIVMISLGYITLGITILLLTLIDEIL